MAEYQRIISYLYEYKNGVRGENIGFIRVETRNQQLKISFTLNASSIPGSPLILYFYHYDHGKMIGIAWDEISNIPSHYEYKETFQLEDVFEENASINDMDGILFYYNEQHFLGSQWNETPINLRVFEKPEKRVPQLEEYMEALTLHEPKIPEPVSISKPIQPVTSVLSVDREEESNATIKESTNIPEADIRPQTPKETVQSVQTEQLKTEQSKNKKESEKSVSITPNSQRKPDETRSDGFIGSNAAANENASISTCPVSSRKWEDYPKITPCPTPDFSSCIKIQIKDIPSFSFLPQELTGNGFLKLQVQNYGYLLLGKKKLTDCHYIGIPGIFSNQRNFVAHLFGFPEFITVPHQEQNTGSFGYWIMTIDH